MASAPSGSKSSRRRESCGHSDGERPNSDSGSITSTGSKDILVQFRKDIVSLTGTIKDMGLDVSDLKIKYSEMRDYVESFEHYDEHDDETPACPRAEQTEAEAGELSSEESNSVPQPKKLRLDSTASASAKCDMLQKLTKDVALQETCGANITPALAQAVDGIVASGIGEDKLEERETKYQIPEDNQPLWNSLSSATCGRDLKMQEVLDGLVKV